MGMEYTKGRKRPPRKTRPWKEREARWAAWQASKTSQRERDLMDRPDTDEQRSADALAQMNKPRKPNPTVFTAKERDTCSDCNRSVEVGDRVHIRPGVGVVHHRHDRSEPEQAPCPTCWLVGPCDCE